MTNLLRWLIILACLMSLMSYSQSADSLYHVETRDGNEFIGTLVEQNQTEIKLKTEKLGLITIKKVEIKSMEFISADKIKQGQYWFHNPQSTRYFWQPTGYGLKKGEGYYQNVWIFGNQVSAGLTDNISIGVGLVPLFLFGGAPTPIWVTPKVSIPIKKDKVNIGLGVLAGTVVAGSDWDSGGSFGIAYGTTTFGSRDQNLSLGIGYGYAGGSWASKPVVTMSFMNRISDKGYLVSENYIFPGGTGLISLGGRRLVKKVSIDFGLFIPLAEDMDAFVAIPWLGIAVPFHKQQTSK